MLKLPKKLLEIEFVVFGPSNIKNVLKILQYIRKTHAKYLVRARALIFLNDAQKFRDYADFSSFFSQIHKISNVFRGINFYRKGTLSIKKTIYF